MAEETEQGKIVDERYAYRVYGASGSTGQIRRFSDHTNGTSDTFKDFSSEEAQAMKRAADFIRRNDPGDRAKAVALLKEQFGEDNVSEAPA